jgi:serine/threonine protein kinase
MTFLSKGIRSALNFLHKHGVTHCDLKLDNIVVRLQQPDRPLLQLIDLGLADEHGAGTGLNRLVAFFPQRVVDTWSNPELDNFAASQCCLHLFVSHKCRGSKTSMWRELGRMYVRTMRHDVSLFPSLLNRAWSSVRYRSQRSVRVRGLNSAAPLLPMTKQKL